MIFEALDYFNWQVRKHMLFENDLMATRKWSKETKSDFIERIRFVEHFNFKRYSSERKVIWKNTIFN